MKRFAFAFALLALSACVPMPVNSAMDSCPEAQNITGYAFYTAAPPTGAEIPATAAKDGGQEWDLPGTAYLQCRYKDGSILLRKLPSSMDRCREKDLRLTCTAWL